MPPSPSPIPDTYRERVGSLNLFDRRDTQWSYTLTYGFIDHHGREQKVTCDLSRLDHEQEVAAFGYDEAEYYAQRDSLVRQEVEREIRARGLTNVVTVTVAQGGWEWRSQVPAGIDSTEEARHLEGVRRFKRWMKEDLPQREEAIDQRLLASRGLRLDGQRQEIDYGALAERASRPLADCFRALQRTGNAGGERESLGVFLAFFQEIRYQVPPDRTGTRHTFGFFVPTEVLAGNHGDCDSKAVAFAAMWRNLDAPLLLIRVPNHMLVGVGVRPGPGEKTVRLGNRTFVLCEVAGPGKLRPGETEISGSFEYVLLEPALSGAPPQRGAEGT